jgi:RND superfamily putative drug exporter
MTTYLLGGLVVNDDFNTIAQRDLRTGELVGVLVALLVLLVVFGALVAGIIPIATGIASLTLLPAILGLFGLAVAVLVDATVVRSVLVPASMKLLGKRNWYLPRWLQWLPDLHIEGGEPMGLVTTSPLATERPAAAVDSNRRSETKQAVG